MTPLERRIETLEETRGSDSVLFVFVSYVPGDKEARRVATASIDGKTFSRSDDESDDAFFARVEASVLAEYPRGRGVAVVFFDETHLAL